MVNAPFDPNTNLEEQHDTPKEHRDHPKDSKSVFIWLDILGFSNDVEGAQDNEANYTTLKDNLTTFQDTFQQPSEYTSSIQSTIISDGILLELKLYSSDRLVDRVEKFINYIEYIGKAQLTFFKKKRKLIRGGISVANSVQENTKNGVFLTYGLSAAVKMEKKVCWPIIGMDEGVLKELARVVSNGDDEQTVLDDIKKNFKKTYNSDGDLIYFIDFLDQPNRQLEDLIKEKFDQKDKGIDTADNTVIPKYSWLYRYYISKIQRKKTVLEEVETGALLL